MAHINIRESPEIVVKMLASVLDIEVPKMKIKRQIKITIDKGELIVCGINDKLKQQDLII